jgi:hypothetical protein
MSGAEDLPAELLLQVFALIPPATQLLVVARVCRRWRRLVLHLATHASVFDCSEARAAAASAPLVGDDLFFVLRSLGAAVAGLDASGCTDLSDAALLALPPASLRRLRLDDTSFGVFFYARLGEHFPALEELSLAGCPGPPTRLARAPAFAPSLRVLHAGRDLVGRWPMQAFTALTTLHLAHTETDRVAELARCPALTSLTLTE